MHDGCSVILEGIAVVYARAFFLSYEIKSENRGISRVRVTVRVRVTLLLLGLLPARAPMRLLATRLAG